MDPHRRILFATDFSDAAERAFAHAHALAACAGAELHMLHVNVLHAPMYPEFSFPGSRQIEQDMESTANELMRHKAGDHAVQVITHTVRDISAGSAIVEYAADNDIDLIVVGSHRHKGLTRAFLGSTARDVVQAASVSVLVVGESERFAPPQGGRYARVLAPVDFSVESRNAAQIAAQWAQDGSDALTLLHVVDILRMPRFHVELPDEQLQLSRDELKRFAHETELVNRAELRVVAGRTQDEIVRYAHEQDVDLIVVAPAGFHEIGERLLGSVTERTVRLAECPVLVPR